MTGGLLGLGVRALFPDEHNPIALVLLEAGVITVVVQALARVAQIREILGGATRGVRTMLSFLLFFTVFGHVGKVSQLTFPFSAWNMYDNGPRTRDLYRFFGVQAEGEKTPLCPAELYAPLGSFRLASTMTQCAVLATVSEEELARRLGDLAPRREDSVRELDELCAALATAHTRVHGSALTAVTVEKCLMPAEDPADLRCESVYEWGPR